MYTKNCIMYVDTLCYNMLVHVGMVVITPANQQEGYED